MVSTNCTTLRMNGALSVEHLTSLELQISVNAHGWAIVEGEAGENALEQIRGAVAGREQHILTLDESGVEKCLFAGVIREAKLVLVDGYKRFHVELLSGTCLMDREIRSRSFQDVSQTYSQVAKQVCSEYSGGATICTVGEDKTLDQPVIQYRETDWGFLMRLASHCGGVLVPEVHRGLPRLWFGFPNRSFTCSFPEDAYTSGISSRYYELGGSAAGYRKADFFYYEVKSSQLCDLGWYTVFKGQLLTIFEKYARLERGELIFTYRFGGPGLGWGKMIYNEKISGMTLIGEVLETARETLKLKLDIDIGWNPGGPYPYTWRPETGNFMYCMPQVGTRVSLYCPNYDEKTAIVVNCVRTNGGDCDRMNDPSKRSFVTEHGKEMNLYPKEMSLIGGDKGKIQLSDKDGVNIISHKPIVICGRDSVRFEAPSVIVKASSKEIILVKKSDFLAKMPDSCFNICQEYHFVAKNYTYLEGAVCTEKFNPLDDDLKDPGINWLGVALIAVGAMVLGAIVIVALPFVIGSLVTGALAGALRGARIANENELSGSEFWTVVGLSALTGGVEKAVSDTANTVMGILSVASPFLTPIMTRLKRICNFSSGLSLANIIPNVLASINKPGLQEWIEDHIPQWQVGEAVEVLSKNPYTTAITQYGLAPSFFYVAGFEQDDDGVYHARWDALQAEGGYNDFYDFVFGYATDMRNQRIDFSCGGKDYVLWAWKGDYLNLGAGAELGIYEQYGDSDHYIVNKENALPMTLRLEDKYGTEIITYTPEEKQWWITGFNPFEPSPKAGDLTAIYTVDFSGDAEKQEMYYAVKAKLLAMTRDNAISKESWTCNDETYTIQFELQN